MVKGIGVLDKSTILAFHCQLDLAQHIPVVYIDQHIVGAPLQTVDHPHKGQIAIIAFGLPHYLVVDANDLLLARSALASEQIHHLESDEVYTHCQSGVLLCKLAGYCQQAVDKSVEILDGVGVEVVDNV